MIKRFRNRRSVFAAHNSNGIKLLNFSVISIGDAPAQAEGLLVRGDEILVENVTIDASGDALQATGKIYMENVSIKGDGDNVLGYGAVFLKIVNSSQHMVLIYSQEIQMTTMEMF